jgi:hypothetical protein
MTDTEISAGEFPVSNWVNAIQLSHDAAATVYSPYQVIKEQYPIFTHFYPEAVSWKTRSKS